MIRMIKQATKSAFFLSIILLSLIMLIACTCGGGSSNNNDQGKFSSLPGPLKVHPSNSRYFTDGTGKAIYLTGSHTWANLIDKGKTDPPPVFDYEGYLDFLKKYNHNFIRLWSWELTKHVDRGDGSYRYSSPFPWLRTGPGIALDGKPKFDLNQFDHKYFDRLRQRVIAAGEKGIYVSIMLFEGWGIYFLEPPWCWNGHPFNINNNINEINGDPNGDNRGLESHTLHIPEIIRVQEEYVRKVIDTVNDLDNVLYEISNEDHIDSVKWQYHMIDFIHKYEKSKPKQHPVGMTTHAKVGNLTVYKSNADWISPSVITWGDDNDPYKIDPPKTDGKKVVIVDSDHLWGMGGDRTWVWKSFLRGYHVIYMDNLTASGWGEWDPEDARKAMGQTLSYASRLNLASMTPQNNLSSTNYCLADPGKEYIVYQPESNSAFTLRLLAGTYSYEWFNPESGSIASTGDFVTNRGAKSFTPPFDGDSVLYIYTSP
jgi:hypothetical protein